MLEMKCAIGRLKLCHFIDFWSAASEYVTGQAEGVGVANRMDK